MDGSRRFFIFLPPSAELGRGEGRGIIFLISQGFQSGFLINVFPVLNQVISVSRKWTWNRQKTRKFQVYFWDFVYLKFIFEINKLGMLKEVVATLFRNLSCSEVGIFCWRSIPNICCLRGFAEDLSQQLQRHFYFLKGVNEGNLVIWNEGIQVWSWSNCPKFFIEFIVSQNVRKIFNKGWFSG